MAQKNLIIRIALHDIDASVAVKIEQGIAKVIAKELPNGDIMATTALTYAKKPPTPEPTPKVSSTIDNAHGGGE